MSVAAVTGSPVPMSVCFVVRAEPFAEHSSSRSVCAENEWEAAWGSRPTALRLQNALSSIANDGSAKWGLPRASTWQSAITASPNHHRQTRQDPGDRLRGKGHSKSFRRHST